MAPIRRTISDPEARRLARPRGRISKPDGRKSKPDGRKSKSGGRKSKPGGRKSKCLSLRYIETFQWVKRKGRPGFGVTETLISAYRVIFWRPPLHHASHGRPPPPCVAGFAHSNGRWLPSSLAAKRRGSGTARKRYMSHFFSSDPCLRGSPLAAPDPQSGNHGRVLPARKCRFS
jgi:hypothetical protein